MDPTPPSADPEEPTSPGSEPFESSSIDRAFRRPDLALDLVLSAPARYSATLASPTRGRLVRLTLAVAVLASLPFGFYFGASKLFHVAALFLGSIAICGPSLHVFANYVGVSLRVEQSFGIALLAASVASAFSLGFAPIVFFLRATIADEAERASMGPLVGILLGLSLAAGMIQVLRSLTSGPLVPRTASFGFVVCGWFLLLAFIAERMGRVLGLGA